MRAALQRHRLLVVILGLGLLVRALVALAYRPALFYSDSWTYAELAYDESPSGFPPDRPIGYSLILRVLAIPARSLTTVTVVQHLAGLAIGALVYALLLRLRIARTWAAVAAGVVVLDAYLITLEQTLMPEVFFGLMLMLGAFLTVGRDRGTIALVAGGLLIGASATVRSVGVFAIPVWMLYVLWAHHGRGVRLLGPALVAVVVPVFAYSAAHSVATGTFGLAQTQGWFLYGRVGEIGECRDADIPAESRFLCNRTAADVRRADEGPLYWIWNERSPARRRFAMTDPRSDDVLGGYAKAIIRDRPGEYASMVAGDFLRFFTPGVASKGGSDDAITLPSAPRTEEPLLTRRVRDARLPSYEPQVHPPADAVRAYAGVVHTPRPLLAAFVLAALVALVVRHSPRRREAFLFCGMAVSMLLASAATSEFVLRYLMPVAPLIVVGGVAATADVLAAARARAWARQVGIAARKVSPIPTFRRMPDATDAR